MLSLEGSRGTCPGAWPDVGQGPGSSVHHRPDRSTTLASKDLALSKQGCNDSSRTAQVKPTLASCLHSEENRLSVAIGLGVFQAMELV